MKKKNEELESRLKTYTSNHRHKKYYDNNTEIVKQRAKNYMEKVKETNPEKLKDFLTKIKESLGEDTESAAPISSESPQETQPPRMRCLTEPPHWFWTVRKNGITLPQAHPRNATLSEISHEHSSGQDADS